MKLVSFVLGMIAASTAVGALTWLQGGSWGLVIAMIVATLLVAQIMYFVLVLVLARREAASHSAVEAGEDTEVDRPLPEGSEPRYPMAANRSGSPRS